MDTPCPADARQCIPHRPPIVFVDSAAETAPQVCASEYRVPPGTPYTDGSGKLLPEAMLEVMAQCFAACTGMEAMKQGKEVTRGYLAGIKGFRVHSTASVGDLLHAECSIRASIGGVHAVSCTVWRGDDAVAEADLKIFIPDAGDPA